MRKLISLLVIGLLLIFNFSLLKSSYESAQKLDSISEEEDKVKGLKEINETLEGELKRRESYSFIEEEARNRLGLGKPGETAIVVENEDINQANGQVQNESTNFQKWIKLLKI